MSVNFPKVFQIIPRSFSKENAKRIISQRLPRNTSVLKRERLKLTSEDKRTRIFTKIKSERTLFLASRETEPV